MCDPHRRVGWKNALVCMLCAQFIVFSIMTQTPSVLATKIQTKAWDIDYQISTNRVEPGRQLWMSFSISIKTQTYDFELWVRPGAPLSADRDGHVLIASLSPGEKRLENFTIQVPPSVTEKEVYAINFRVQSYSSPPPIWGRIGQSPDDVFDTTTKPEYAEKVEIVTRPTLMIATFSSNPSSPEEGQAFTTTAVVANTGTGPLEMVSLNLNVDPSLSIQEGKMQNSIDELGPGKSSTITWKIIAQHAGTYSMTLEVSALNYQRVTAVQTIQVSSPSSQAVILLTPLIPIVVIVIIAIVILKKQ